MTSDEQWNYIINELTATRRDLINLKAQLLATLLGNGPPDFNAAVTKVGTPQGNEEPAPADMQVPAVPTDT